MFGTAELGANDFKERTMATYSDPHTHFAPLEVIERLLEIRADLGFSPFLYIDRNQEIADFLDCYGFDSYAFSTKNEKLDVGQFTSPVVPGGDLLRSLDTNH